MSPKKPSGPNESHANAHDERLSIREKVGYGLGDTACNLYWKFFQNFQLIFYTDVFGISAAAAGTMFLVTKVWDAVNDPLVGFLSDRTKTSWGRFRPYLLWMALPFSITGILTFYTPDLSENSKLIYAYVTYALVFMAYTSINIPYNALLGVISTKSVERTSVSFYRFVLAYAGGLIVQFFTNPLVRFFGGTKEVVTDGATQTIVANPQAGFFWTVVCYASAAAILFLITFLSTKERVVEDQTAKVKPITDISDLLRNRPWIALLFVGLFQLFAGWIRGSATAYYFNYFAVIEVDHLVDLGTFGKYFNVGDFGFFFGAGTICGIAGMFFTKPLVKLFGQKRLVALIMLGNAILMAALLLVEKDQWTAMYALHCAATFISGPFPILVWAMYADTADYSEWLNGRRATGLVFAVAGFFCKLGSALGSAVPGWVLGTSGFVAPVDDVPQAQPESAISAIIYMMTVMPAACYLMGFVAILFYNLDTKLLSQIESDLAQRRSEMPQNRS